MNQPADRQRIVHPPNKARKVCMFYAQAFRIDFYAQMYYNSHWHEARLNGTHMYSINDW